MAIGELTVWVHVNGQPLSQSCQPFPATLHDNVVHFTHGASLLLAAAAVFAPADATYVPLASINNPTSKADCPAAWKFADASGTGVCVPPHGPGCFSVSYTPGVRYRFVRGSVSGVQFGQVCGFGPSTRTHLLSGTSRPPSGEVQPVIVCCYRDSL